ncbi:hypothetical protein [Paenibacillus sp. CECT 9249]|uniref:hypothetical protein n=1 Tax=Paenibacillus sp. CECT 9249 TaxID=2845385 RepID=UPI001E527FED|nr:hypothetical protein [Paenibacillus sp. CECT 9249]
MDDLVLYKKHIESIISEFKQFGMLSVCIGFYFSILALILNATFEISQGAFLLIVTIMSLGILFVVKNYYSGYRINYIKKEIIEMIINERLDGTHTKPVKKYRNRLRK